MNFYKLYTKLYKPIFNKKIVFSQSDVGGMMSYIDSCRSGSFIIFDEVRLENNKTGQIVYAEAPTYIFDIKVLALSTMDSETAIIKMIKHGAKGYVLKDAEPSELKQAFDDLLSKGFYYNDIVSRKIIQSVNLLVDDSTGINTFAKLSDGELTFLKLACSEKTYVEIAKEMFVSERTVDGYRETLFRKLNVSTRVGLVMFAIKNELVKL